MKRTKLMAGTLVLATALLGTGYAAWTDVLEVNATVSTGTLDVKFDSVTATIKGKGSDYVGEADKKQTTGVSECAVTDEDADGAGILEKQGKDDILSFNFSNLNPAATVTVTAPIKNVGTVPVQLTNGDANANIDETTEGIKATVQFAGGEALGGDAKDLEALTLKVMGDAKLDPDETKNLVYTFTAVDSNTSQNIIEGKTTIKLNWQQADGTNELIELVEE